jgi:pimeloyl-ACP methyl ester carboxylesterase
MVLANGTPRRPLETLFHNNALQAGFRLLKRTYDISPELVEFIWKLQKGNPVARTLMALAGFNPHLTPPEDVQLYLDQVADMDPRVLLYLIENYDTYDATAWLHTIRAPTLILGGENDHAIPIAQQELMHQLIPGSRLEVIRHGSHCPQMDLPELVNLKIEGFLREMGYGAQLPKP